MITFKLSIISKLHASIYANIFKFSREQFPQNDFSEIKTNHYVCSQLLSEKLLLKTRWDTKSRLGKRDFLRLIINHHFSIEIKKTLQYWSVPTYYNYLSRYFFRVMHFVKEKPTRRIQYSWTSNKFSNADHNNNIIVVLTILW